MCGHVILPKFLGWVDYHIFLGMGYARARLRKRVELCYKFLDFHGLKLIRSLFSVLGN